MEDGEPNAQMGSPCGEDVRMSVIRLPMLPGSEKIPWKHGDRPSYTPLRMANDSPLICTLVLYIGIVNENTTIFYCV